LEGGGRERERERERELLTYINLKYLQKGVLHRDWHESTGCPYSTEASTEGLKYLFINHTNCIIVLHFPRFRSDEMQNVSPKYDFCITRTVLIPSLNLFFLNA
jgi:hypothetical protein